MACARCGCGVYQTEDIITLNKIWHKCCFTCYRCKQHLDKCNAKIFQGEVFCDSCYNCMINQLEKSMFEEPQTKCPPKPCKVVSSPTCTCGKESKVGCCKEMPSFDYCKKYEVCFPAEPKVKCCKTGVRSCSCIPDRCCEKKEIDCREYPPHCFAFPIPREVANYYNRIHMMPRQYTSPPNCCRPPKCEERRIKIRAISPCRKPSPSCKPCAKCCCTKCSKACRPCPPRPMCYHTRRRCSPIIQRNDCSSCCPEPCQPDPCVEDHCRPDPACCPDRPCRRTPTCRPATGDRFCCSRSPCRRPSPPCRAASPCSPSPCRVASPCSPSSCRVASPCSPSPCRVASPCRPKPSSCGRRSPCRQRSPCGRASSPCCRPASPCSGRSPARCENKPCPGKLPKYCACGSLNPCSCKMSQIRQLCTAICIRCNHKVYAAERILVTSGAYHTSCFSCYCCHKLLDVKNVYENCGEIYCKQCYNSFFGIQYYGFGTSNIC